MRKILKYLIVLFLLYILLYSILKVNNKIYEGISNLSEDGFKIIKGVLIDKEIKELVENSNSLRYNKMKELILSNKRLKEEIKYLLGVDYVLHDYIWIIKKSRIHTCHRDNNGDFFNKGQKKASYTIIIYLEEMGKCLGVISGSHKRKYSNSINIENKVENVLCKKGDMIIFNGNLIHVGTILEKNDNLRIQLKVSHKDDIKHLSYYENFNKILNKENNMPKSILNMQYNLSCLFPIISDITQKENIKSARGSSDGREISILQKIYSLLFYSDSSFYDLPNF